MNPDYGEHLYGQRHRLLTLHWYAIFVHISVVNIESLNFPCLLLLPKAHNSYDKIVPISFTVRKIWPLKECL